MGSQGRFISFEGMDGCGKSTQARLLAERLKADGHDVVLTREPGGSAGAEDIRRLLVEGNPGRWSPETEILLFTAARRDHMERLIAPALERGAIVITDRFADSTRVYQGAARADLRDVVDALHQMMIGQEPDMTIVLDMEAGDALQRGLARRSGEDRFEDMGLPFQERLRRGFQELVRDNPKRCRLISANGSETEIAGRIDETVGSVFA
ncbi:dTMP kinase [Algicella marina]|uniref:Thymidylate kinase n=1 Tax=Algicella marina TaxID=2683284 RepID=A0A6P1SZL2_9RHOB|nr:dTMP kinase [Algicella marina]QHQ34891.1 dTMP kinase [Algicella marina]